MQGEIATLPLVARNDNMKAFIAFVSRTLPAHLLELLEELGSLLLKPAVSDFRPGPLVRAQASLLSFEADVRSLVAEAVLLVPRRAIDHCQIVRRRHAILYSKIFQNHSSEGQLG